MDPGTESEIVEGLNRCGGRLILVELRCLDDHTLGPISAHFAPIEDQVITIGIAPVRAEHRRKPAAAGSVEFFYLAACLGISQFLPSAKLFNTKFNWCRKQNFKDMSDAGQQLMTYVAVVNQLCVLSQFTQCRLESHPVAPQVFQQTLPPVRALLDDLVEFCLGYAIAPARLNEHLASDTSVAKGHGHGFRQTPSLAGRALIDCNDWHDG